MKKILLILLLIPMFGLSQVSIPTISNVTITQQPYCPGDYGSMQINVNQTSPLTTYKCLVGSNAGPFFISYISTSLTTPSTLNITGFLPNVEINLDPISLN